MWWFAKHFGYTPSVYKALSYADKQALMAVDQGVMEYRESVKKKKRGK